VWCAIARRSERLYSRGAVTNPADIVKVRQQLLVRSDAAVGTTTNFVAIARRMVRDEVRALHPKLHS
jgi:hypothetical protein